jgi:hypothetical protein
MGGSCDCAQDDCFSKPPAEACHPARSRRIHPFRGLTLVSTLGQPHLVDQVHGRPARRRRQQAHDDQHREAGRSFDDVESELERGWEAARGKSSMEWTRARLAAYDAWEHARTGEDRAA